MIRRKAEAGCSFCQPLAGTPADIFGRLRGHYAITASNVAKYDAWHGVIIFDEHHPLRFTAEQVSDYVDLAQEWAEKVHQVDPEARYPLLVWNCLWRSGSSILHGHAQVAVARGMHFAGVEAWRQAALRYRAAYNSDYFADLAAVYRALGLAVECGSATTWPSLTPVKEKETHIVAPRLDGDLKAALYHTLHTFVERLGVRSFNLALYQPPLGRVEEGWDGFPFIVRLVDRGPLDSNTSDLGAMELFAESVVMTDPFRVAEALRRSED
jgi:galactose-1-phosphate uridylyltransferase